MIIDNLQKHANKNTRSVSPRKKSLLDALTQHHNE